MFLPRCGWKEGRGGGGGGGRERVERQRKGMEVKCLAGKGRHINIPLKSGNTSGSGLYLVEFGSYNIIYLNGNRERERERELGLDLSDTLLGHSL